MMRNGGRGLGARGHRRRGFTLIELLVVIVVLGVLATLVAPNVFRHVGTAKEATARAQIEMLGAALDAYRLDTGRYPTTEQGLAALWQQPSAEPRPTVAARGQPRRPHAEDDEQGAQLDQIGRRSGRESAGETWLPGGFETDKTAWAHR